MTEEKKYALAIKRGRKNYLPLEWSLADSYQGENLSTIEGIDSFTLNTDIPTLLTDMINKSVVEPDEPIQEISIIFHEKGNIREVPYGPIFNDFKDLVTHQAIKNFIFTNFHNKQIMNKLYNYLNKNTGKEEIDKLRLVLNNTGSFIVRGENYIRLALDVIDELDYETMRNLALYIELVIKPKLKEENINKTLSKNNDQKAA